MTLKNETKFVSIGLFELILFNFEKIKKINNDIVPSFGLFKSVQTSMLNPFWKELIWKTIGIDTLFDTF